MAGLGLKPTSSAFCCHAPATRQASGSGQNVDVEHLGPSQQEQRVKVITLSWRTQTKNWLSQNQFQLLLKPIQTFLKTSKNDSYFSINFILKTLEIQTFSNLVHGLFF